MPGHSCRRLDDFQNLLRRMLRFLAMTNIAAGKSEVVIFFFRLVMSPHNGGKLNGVARQGDWRRADVW